MPIFWLISSTAARAVGDVLAVEHLVDRHRGLVAVRHRPDDVLRAEGASPPKNTFGLVDWKVVSSSLGRPHSLNSMPASRSIQGKAFSWPTATSTSSQGKCCVRLAGRHQLAAALGVVLGLHLLEGDAGELAVVVGEFLRHQVIVDRDALVHGVFLFPRRRLHFLEARAHHHVDLLAAEPARRAAAVHGGIAAAEHDHALADLAWCGRTTPRRASRCRYGCSWPLPCGRECRGRARAARRSRRRSRRSPRPAAPSCCRCACRRGIRRRDRGCSRIPRR